MSHAPTGSPAAGEHVWGTAPGFVGPRHELREELLLDLLLSGCPGPRVLNVGAGQGSFTRLLEARGHDVVSTDVSDPALDVLRRNVRGAVLDADMTDLPFPDDSFDAVVAGEVLEHIEDDRRALSEAARVLRRGGVLAMSVPAQPDWFGPSDRWAGHVRRYTRHRLEEAIHRAGGLRLDVLKPWGFPMSALYHRAFYDRRAERLAEGQGQPRAALAVLRLVLRIDHLFVGVERGCLGYLALARATSPSTANLSDGRSRSTASCPSQAESDTGSELSAELRSTR